MAEGGDLSSAQCGSNTEFEFTCTPCGADGIAQEAVKHCPECQEHLCTACSKYHGLLKALREHKLVDAKDSAKHATAVKTDKTSVTCRYHPEGEIEMYCGVHNMVCCNLCIATAHRLCNPVSNIEDVPTPGISDLQLLQAEVKIICNQLRVTNGNKMKNTKAISAQRVYILSRIQEEKRKMTEHLESLEMNAKDALSATYGKIKDELDTDISTTSDLITELQKTMRQLEAAVMMATKQRFVQMNLAQNIVIDAKKLCSDSEFKGNREICFTGNAFLDTADLETTSLGQIETKLLNMKKNKTIIKRKAKKCVNVRDIMHDNNSCIVDVCQLPDGTVILADYDCFRLKRLDANYNVIDFVFLRSHPYSIFCVDQKTVAVNLTDGNIQLVSVGNSMCTISSLWATSLYCDRFGLEHYDNAEFFVITKGVVNVYKLHKVLNSCNMNRTIFSTIEEDSKGWKLFKSQPLCIAVRNDSILVTCGSDGGVCCRRDGTVRNELRSPMLIGSRGICVSKAGIVFIAGSRSNNIVMFLECGECLGELVSARDRIVMPMSLCYDDCNDCIIVTCTDSDFIHVIELCN